jgi:hypothetical protein
LQVVIAVAISAALCTSAFTQAKFGTADEAKAMLAKAIAAVKADKAKALEMFNKGGGGFLDRDIYPFCINFSDGKILATQAKQALGVDVRTLKDAAGRNFGQEGYDAAMKLKEGEEFRFMLPRPGADKTPVQKVAFLMKAGDFYCGVGYYK